MQGELREANLFGSTWRNRRSAGSAKHVRRCVAVAQGQQTVPGRNWFRVWELCGPASGPFGGIVDMLCCCGGARMCGCFLCVIVGGPRRVLGGEWAGSVWRRRAPPTCVLSGARRSVEVWRAGRVRGRRCLEPRLAGGRGHCGHGLAHVVPRWLCVNAAATCVGV